MTLKLVRCVALAAMIAGITQTAMAEDGGVKIGVLADMSGVYADIGGQGSVEAV